MNDQSILITGADGFLGKELYTYLIQNYPRANILSLSRQKSKISDDPLRFTIDLSNKSEAISFLKEKKPDYCFHFAGKTYSKEWNDLYRDNVKATQILLESIKELGLMTRILIPGSAAEYGAISQEKPITEDQVPNPISPYGLSKAFQTAFARYSASQGVNVVIVRIFNIIENRVPYSFIGEFSTQIKKIKNGTLHAELEVGDLSPKRDFLDLQDLCKGLVKAVLRGKSGEIYNLCSGKTVSMGEILELMLVEAEVKAVIKPVPHKMRQNEILYSCGSKEKSETELDWKSKTSLKQAIHKLFNPKQGNFYES